MGWDFNNIEVKIGGKTIDGITAVDVLPIKIIQKKVVHPKWEFYWRRKESFFFRYMNKKIKVDTKDTELPKLLEKGKTYQINFNQ